ALPCLPDQPPVRCSSPGSSPRLASERPFPAFISAKRQWDNLPLPVLTAGAAPSPPFPLARLLAGRNGSSLATVGFLAGRRKNGVCVPLGQGHGRRRRR
uniref:Uncharacterized protein n=1 Tax=Aegilops tauschii subsp. strangulata TaxID=200361 RepID=A0A453CPV1_AEGTS